MKNKKFICKIELTRTIKAEDEEQAQNKFWEEVEYEFEQDNTTLEVELNDSMKINEVENEV